LIPVRSGFQFHESKVTDAIKHVDAAVVIEEQGMVVQ
jgi:hypothetical protein